MSNLHLWRSFRLQLCGLPPRPSAKLLWPGRLVFLGGHQTQLLFQPFVYIFVIYIHMLRCLHLCHLHLCIIYAYLEERSSTEQLWPRNVKMIFKMETLCDVNLDVLCRNLSLSPRVKVHQVVCDDTWY